MTISLQSLCDPDSLTCSDPGRHLSTSCYPRYVSLCDPDDTDQMDYHQWRATCSAAAPVGPVVPREAQDRGSDCPFHDADQLCPACTFQP